MYSVVVFTPTDRTQQNCIVASRTDSCVDPISLIQPNPTLGITDVDPTQPTDQQIWQAKTVFIMLKEYCKLSVCNSISVIAHNDYGFTFLVPAYRGCPGKVAVKRMY